ncbi:head GIN domain-containing protein [Epilithonimonas hominis]|uniref:head GIN domain-containing protein n=1 Tax=Epilithonimonas hominis TaxID=420404 RepID=UPI0028966316|nr:head GIN domain-containing protein [Epilithonimonas hominis]
MKNIILAAAVTLVSQFSLAQSKSVAAFTSLKVFDKIPVQLIPSSDYKAEISGSKSDDIEFVNSGNELKVRMKTLQLLQGDDVKVVLYYKNINSIQASQGAVITSADKINASKLEVTSNEGSQIDINVDTAVLEGKVNTGGILKLAGESDSQSVVVNTGGKYDGQNLKTSITSITTNAGGQASVYASKSVDATTRAGGVIDVYGNPTTKNDKKIVGGKINYH